MASLLREAFGLACLPFRKIHDLYDLTGYYAWRALTDDRFPAISPAEIQSRPLRRAAETYDRLVPRARATFIEKLGARGAQSDFGPGPDIKPALLRLGKTFLLQASRMHWHSPVVTGAAFMALAAGAYALSGGSPHSVVPDVVGTIYGSSPGNPQPGQN